MHLEDVDLVMLSKLLSLNIEQYNCIYCCKYYVAPETAACGHTLCHYCWGQLKTCPDCAKPFERSHLRHNQPIQKITEQIQALARGFEKLFNINLNELLMDTNALESENDPTKNVQDWLASSQNHFSVPPQNSEQSSQQLPHPNPMNVSSNKIQLHTNAPKSKNTQKVVLVSIPQDDWDKIEPMPDTEDITKNKENIVGPTDIEPFYVDDSEYTATNPRRSSRKREMKPTDASNITKENTSSQKQTSKDSSGEIDKKSGTAKQNWNNVKRMRKEFSKLNKKNRNKLNVSIEMCNKTKNSAKANGLPQVSSQVYDIDENTPENNNIKNQAVERVSKEHNVNAEDKNSNVIASPISDTKNNRFANKTPELSLPEAFKDRKKIDNQETYSETKQPQKHDETTQIKVSKEAVKMPFYKRSALRPKDVETNTTKTINHNIDTNTCASDDVQITVRVGDTITNIFIKRKNDVEFKLNTDRAVQTSLGSHDVFVKNVTSPQKPKTQNIVINVGEKHEVGVEHQSKPSSSIIDKQLKAAVSIKTVSDKKNTDSADTATAQFEITESVEKELSKVMECVDDKSTKTTTGENSSQSKSQKPANNQDDLEYLNDVDIFESESVKESDVQLLRHVEHAPSEILLCTVKTKNRTQKHTEKRNRDTNDENLLPDSKKAKLGNNNSANEIIKPIKSKQNQPESEPMNYDAIMGTVFASIDVDLEEIRQSQTIVKNTYTLNNNSEEIEHHKQKDKYKESQEKAISANRINRSANVINEDCNQKDSENVFSVCVTQKTDKQEDVAPINDKVPQNVLQPNIDDFLTPVMSHKSQTPEEVMAVVEINDDSDKSIVEETPQKTTSFSKMQQKNNGNNKELNNSQMVVQSQTRRVVSSAKEITTINILTNTSAEISKDLTIIETVDKKSLETPMNINSFMNQIQHKSTPVARKSLNFDTEDMDDLEQTMCSTNEVVKTTQEKEFMRKVFESTPKKPSLQSLGLRNLGLKHKKYCIAGSCLTPAQIQKLKLLCTRQKCTFSDKFSNDLTHLVVSVDEENKSQRSVKYMCALASSKWIVTYEWVEKCLQSNEMIDEKSYEALDSTGEPGPKRSRVASKKIFQGITFYCMEPFSVLDVDTLKVILEAAGGRVVKNVKEVTVDEKCIAPAILLAEPENTQEDRFIYLAMELSIVPVNYEWVLNCLGSYMLGSIQESLLCPSTLLPKPTENWPKVLLEREDE